MGFFKKTAEKAKEKYKTYQEERSVSKSQEKEYDRQLKQEVLEAKREAYKKAAVEQAKKVAASRAREKYSGKSNFLTGFQTFSANAGMLINNLNPQGITRSPRRRATAKNYKRKRTRPKREKNYSMPSWDGFY